MNVALRFAVMMFVLSFQLDSDRGIDTSDVLASPRAGFYPRIAASLHSTLINPYPGHIWQLHRSCTGATSSIIDAADCLSHTFAMPVPERAYPKCVITAQQCTS